MPRVPIHLSNEDIGTGSTGPQASPTQFGSESGEAVQDLARGFVGLARGISDLGVGIRQLQEKRKADDDRLWVSRATSQFQRGLADFSADPGAYASPDYDKLYEQEARRLRDVLLPSAPSPEAAEEFVTRSGRSFTSAYPGVIDQTSKTRMNADVENLAGDYAAQLTDYVNSENQNAAELMFSNYLQHVQDISDHFATTPLLAKRMIIQAAEDFILSAINKGDAEVAQEILNSTPEFEAEPRLMLQKKIDSLKNETIPAIQKGDFERARSDALLEAKKTGRITSIPLEEYAQIYGAEKAAEEKKSDDLITEAYAWAHEEYAAIKDKSPAIQASRLEELQGAADTVDKQRAFTEVLFPLISDNSTKLKRDRVGWLVQNNPEVIFHQKRLDAVLMEPQAMVDKGLAADLEEATTKIRAASVDLSQRYYDAVLKYQGAPTEGDDPSLYLNLPPKDRHILTYAQAESFAHQINQSPPGAVMDVINGISAQFPNDKFRFQAFSDLVTLPDEPVRQEYQLVFQNKDAWWLDRYIGALQKVGEVKDLSSVKRSDISTALEAHPTWMAFRQSFVGDNLQRAGDVAGFKSGIEIYASAITLQGKSVEESVDMAIKRLVTTTLAPVQMLDQTLMIPRDKEDPNAVPRTDEEAAAIGNGLAYALADVPVGRLDFAQFPDLAPLEPTTRNQRAYELIIENATWQITNDGHGAILYYPAEDGFPFPLRDSDGNMFSIKFEELPTTRTRMVERAPIPGLFPAPGPKEKREQSVRSYHQSRRKHPPTNVPDYFHLIK